MKPLPLIPLLTREKNLRICSSWHPMETGSGNPQIGTGMMERNRDRLPYKNGIWCVVILECDWWWAYYVDLAQIPACSWMENSATCSADYAFSAVR